MRGTAVPAVGPAGILPAKGGPVLQLPPWVERAARPFVTAARGNASRAANLRVNLRKQPTSPGLRARKKCSRQAADCNGRAAARSIPGSALILSAGLRVPRKRTLITFSTRKRCVSSGTMLVESPRRRDASASTLLAHPATSPVTSTTSHKSRSPKLQPASPACARARSAVGEPPTATGEPPLARFPGAHSS